MMNEQFLHPVISSSHKQKKKTQENTSKTEQKYFSKDITMIIHVCIHD